jgi:hypothetical protein
MGNWTEADGVKKLYQWSSYLEDYKSYKTYNIDGLTEVIQSLRELLLKTTSNDVAGKI